MHIQRRQLWPTLNARGMTLVEAMVGVAIVAILASLTAVPFRSALNQQRIAGVRTELTAAMQWARWEALRRNAPITLLRRTDCTTPVVSNDDWHCGWHLVAGANITKASTVEDADVLQAFTVPNGVRLTHPGGGPTVQFARSGYPVLVAHKFIVGLPSDTTAKATPSRHTTTLCINRTGRVRVVEGQTTC
jgi:type IV fimbrial biogenesis protein FimT